MEERIMPLATFRSDDGTQQITVRLTDFHRHENKPDVVSPHPQYNKKPMELIQISYFEGTQ